MPKRKCECKEERYERKIRKLKMKLKKRKNRCKDNRTPSPTPSNLVVLSPTPAPSTPVSSYEEKSDVGECDTELTGAEGSDITKEILDDSIIKALGQTEPTEKAYGPEIHIELVKRVEGIITQGLKQDTKDELVKKFLIPTNAKLLDAPKLNKELEGLLNDTMKARDKRVEERQQQLGVAIAALLSATDKLIKDDVDKIKLISTISDITRLLTDLHHQDTVTRKKLIIPNLDKNVGKSVENQKRDEFLFGEKFNDNVKAATAIKKSAGTILKQTYPNRKITNTSNRPNQPQNYPKKQGNFRGPPRTSSTQFKQGGGGRYHQQNQHYSQKQRPPQRPTAKPSVRQT